MGVTRQPWGMFTDPDAGPPLVGAGPFAHLGATMAPCPGGGYVAGAPGDNSVWLSPVERSVAVLHAATPSLPPTFPVGCQGTAGSFFRGLVGGPDFATNAFPDGGASQLAGARVDAFGMPLTSSMPLAVGNATSGTVRLYRAGAASFPNALLTLTGDAGFGASLAWNQGGLLVVGNPRARMVTTFLTGNTADGGLTQTFAAPIADPEPTTTGSDFGKVVLTGNVTHDFSEEVIVAAPAIGKVYVFAGGSLVLTLSSGMSFGSSLALDPRDLGGGLHALWIGEPAEDSIHRYVGSARVTFLSPASAVGSQFGAAMTVDGQGVAAVGAPLYTPDVTSLEAGAVFEAALDAGVLAGEAVRCSEAVACPLPGCGLGTCVGGVFCQRVSPGGCGTGQVCDPFANVCVRAPDAGWSDAGVTDAGGTDAGGTDAGGLDAGGTDAGGADAGGADAGGADAGRDAGAEDAGQGSDAGVDAGVLSEQVMVFRTCGCGSGGLPVLLLGLLVAQRRGRARGGPRG